MRRAAARWGALVALARGGLCTRVEARLDFPVWTEILEHVQDVSDTEMGRVVELKFIDESQCRDRVVAKHILAREKIPAGKKPKGSIATKVAKRSAMQEICYAHALAAKTTMPSVAVYDAQVVDVGEYDKSEGQPRMFYYLMGHGGRDLLSKWAPMGDLYEGSHRRNSISPKLVQSPAKNMFKSSSFKKLITDDSLVKSNSFSGSAKTKRKRKIDPQVKLALATAMFYQIVSGLKVMQGLQLTHRDIKDENLLVTAFGPSDEPEDLSTAPGPERAWRVAFADFGLMVQGTSVPDISGTPGFMSPEYMRHQVHEEFCMGCTDVWAAGVVLHSLTLGTSKREKFLHRDGKRDLTAEEIEAVAKGIKVDMNERMAASGQLPWWHQQILDMLLWTLAVDPIQRMKNFDNVVKTAHAVAKRAAEDIGRNLEDWIAPPSKSIDKTCFQSMKKANSVMGILAKLSVADCAEWTFPNDN